MISKLTMQNGYLKSILYKTFRYDSTHVGLHRDSSVQVSIADGKLCVNEQQIAVFSERDPKNIPWGASGKTF